MTTRWRPLLVSMAALAVVASACGDDDEGDTTAPPAAATTAPAAAGADPATTAGGPGPTAPARVEGEITVFAAASLTDSFTEVGDAFTAANPDADVAFSFDASSALVRQIIEGAPADVFASADTANMDELVAAGLDGTAPQVFATNELTIIVAPGNPLGITGVADLADPDITTVVCSAEVPCGSYADRVLAAAGVTVTPVSLEQNVRGVASKVTAGEADAGIVYVTDVIAAGGAADMVEIPGDINVVAEYPVAGVADSPNQAVGQAFIDFLTGPDGQTILAEHGFGAP